MKKVGFFLIAIVTAATLAACSRSTEPAANQNKSVVSTQPDNRGEPVMLHARIDYTGGSMTREIGKTGVVLSLDLRQPALRIGKGKNASYSSDDSAPTQVQGFVHGSGHAEMNSNDTHIEEHYDKTGAWHPLQTPTKGFFAIKMPESSDIGDGLQVEVEVHAPVAGEQWTQAYGQQNPDVTFARPLECSERDEYLDDHGAACSVKFHIDPTLSGPKSDAGKILYDKTVDALKQPNGEWVMAMLGQLYGAETTYENDEFVVHILKQSTFDKDGSTINRDIDITVWSSRRDSNWVPKNVTPVKAQ